MVNPIKTPLEILYEQAGVPRFAGGSSVSSGAKQLLNTAVKKFKALSGRAPTAQEMAALEQEVARYSQPTSPIIRSGPSAKARSFHELSTDPNLMNPEGPDPFLTQAMLGRTPKGTRLRPQPMDINDPQVQANIELKQMSGALDEDIPNPSSITPSADYLANMSKAIENEALSGGALDKLKLEFYKKFKRFPTDEELDMLVADFNPARHQYGEKGIGIITERPPTAKGMAEWRNQARAEGLGESLINKSPSDYPGYAQEEILLQKGIVPTEANVEYRKAEGGHISPEEMRHMMIAMGYEPKKFKTGGKAQDDELREYIRTMTANPVGVISEKTLAYDDPYLSVDLENASDMPGLVPMKPTYTERARDVVAKVSPKAADRLFSVNPEASRIDMLTQMVNPANAVTFAADSLADFVDAAKRNDPLGAAVGYGGAMMNIIPGAAAIRKLRKIK